MWTNYKEKSKKKKKWNMTVSRADVPTFIFFNCCWWASASVTWLITHDIHFLWKQVNKSLQLQIKEVSALSNTRLLIFLKGTHYTFCDFLLWCRLSMLNTVKVPKLINALFATFFLPCRRADVSLSYMPINGPPFSRIGC